jgi:hypothetical protein
VEVPIVGFADAGHDDLAADSRRSNSPEVPMSSKLAILAAATMTIGSAALAPSAHAITITRAFSGLWHDSSGANRGFSAEVVSTSSGKELRAYWTTTDASGRPMWVIGKGPIVGNRAVLSAVVGASATPSGASQAWGRLTVAFTDCLHGTVQFAPNDPHQAHGTTTIARLADDSAQGCTGGISDDRATASNDIRIVQFFTNTGAAPGASGKARFEDRGDRTDFKVEAEDLPIGTYSLQVAGAERATLNVATSANGTEGEVEFQSPAEAGKILLDFDPRGQQIDIAQGGAVFLTTKLATGPGGGSSGGSVDHGDLTRYELHVETAHDGPEMKAELEDRTSRTDFSVEIEDFAAGSYTLNVGGTDRGTIDVVAVENGTEGEIEFRDPPEPGHLTLYFDPRGQTVSILQNGAVLLSGTFPTQPTGGGSGGGNGGGDDNGGGGNDDPPGDDNGGGGNDDPPGDDHGGGHGGNGGGDDGHGHH